MGFRRWKLTPKADPPPAQPVQPNINVSGSGNTFFITQGSVTAKFSTTLQWYQDQMAKHGAWYWLMHGIVALVVVALWEYRHWFWSLVPK